MSEPVTLNEVMAAVAQGDGERVLALLHALAEGAYL